MTERGVGALTLSEVARRMGMRQPSLYKYFPSRHAVYDELFGRGARAQLAATVAATQYLEPGIGRLVAGGASVVQWSVANPALAQLMFWRPVPGFVPSASSLSASVESRDHARAEFADAISRGVLRPDTDLDEILILCTVVISGLITQQLSNEPGVAYAAGTFSSRTPQALEDLFAAYTPRRTR